MSVQFYLFPRLLKSGEKPITMSVHIANTRLQTTIGIAVHPNYWLGGSQRLKKSPETSRGLKYNEVNDKLDRITKAFRDFEVANTDPDVSRDTLREILNDALTGESEKMRKDSEEFYRMFDEIVECAKIECQWADSTMKKYKTFRKHLQFFAPKARFSEWTENKLNAFIQYEGDELKMKSVSVKKDLKMLKWFFRKALKKGARIPPDFIRFTPVLKNIANEVVFLTWEELMKLYNFDVPADGATVRLQDMNGIYYDKTVKYRSSLIKTRDLFCFCAFSGLRYSDMASLKRTDITPEYINVITEKTDDGLKVPFNTYSRAIYQKYEDERFPGNLALPVISNQKMNEYLKDLCELCGFNTPVKYSYYVGGVRHDEVYPKWEMLGTHGGRRTFICAAFEMGISPAIVMKITGHKDYEAMKPYIAIMDKSKKAAMDRFSNREIAV